MSSQNVQPRRPPGAPDGGQFSERVRPEGEFLEPDETQEDEIRALDEKYSALAQEGLLGESDEGYIPQEDDGGALEQEYQSQGEPSADSDEEYNAQGSCRYPR